MEEKKKIGLSEFQILFDNSIQPVSIFGFDGKIYKVNSSFLEFYELSENELDDFDFRDFLYPSEKYTLDENIFSDNESRKLELRILTTTSKLKVISRKEFIIDYLGRKVVLALDEETDSFKEHEDIQKLERLALKETANSIVITNLNGDVIWVNPAFEKLTGYSHEEMIYKNIRILNSGKHNNEFFKNLWDTIKSGKVWKGEIINKRKNGEIYFEEQTITPVKIGGDEISYFISIKQDITEKKEAEEKAKLQQEQLIQADKMVALGTLVSGVAHEINNPNNFIMLNAPILLKAWKNIFPVLDKYYEEDNSYKVAGLPYQKFREKFEKIVENILEGSKRIKKIVEDLKKFSRKNAEKIFENVNVNEVVNSAVNLLNNLIKKSTDNFAVELDDSIPVISANYQYLEQIIINFLTNSCQALTDKSKGIKVSTKYDEENVFIIVEDQGIGIKEGDLKHITDPFYTTKRDIGGTGLGLSVSSRIINDLGGQLKFESEYKKGTKATVILPINKRIS